MLSLLFVCLCSFSAIHHPSRLGSKTLRSVQSAKIFKPRTFHFPIERKKSFCKSSFSFFESFLKHFIFTFFPPGGGFRGTQRQSSVIFLVTYLIPCFFINAKLQSSRYFFPPVVFSPELGNMCFTQSTFYSLETWFKSRWDRNTDDSRIRNFLSTEAFKNSFCCCFKKTRKTVFAVFCAAMTMFDLLFQNKNCPISFYSKPQLQ